MTEAFEEKETNAGNIVDDDGSTRKLDEKLMELQSLFEVSQTLNSSLKLKSILDNMLLTPMGKMMISRGIVLLYDSENNLKIETLKGLPSTFAGKKVQFSIEITEPTFLTTINKNDQKEMTFFLEEGIVLLLPIRSSDRNLGYIGFGEKLIKTEYAESELEYLKSISNIAATSIENGLMVMQLQEVNRRLDKKIQELNTLFEIGKELNSTLDKQKVLNLLSYAVMGEMIINRCLIFLEENDEKNLVMSKGLQANENNKRYANQEFLDELFKLSDPILLKPHDKYDKIFTYFRDSGFPVIVPMRLQNVTRGILAIGERITKVEFQDDDLEFLSTLGNEALICLENAKLFEERLEKQRIEEELAMAREIQQKLLPTICPQAKNYQIAGINISSLHVSGDYFDCIQLDENRLCLAIADVSGKGPSASLLMANLQAVLNVLIDTDDSLNNVTSKINNLIHKNTNYDKFITFFIGILNTKDNTFAYVNAGHNPPYLVHKNSELETLEDGGLLLGMMPNVDYDLSTTTLMTGDWIVMFTDGVTEAKNDLDEDYEEERLIEVIQQNKSGTAEEMKQAILESMKEFTEDVPQSDDITILVLKAL
ncbi:hypothetical protein B6I21_05655 [candidate division KSB1 bacterium 4572_119]|nr:MAG: hypothetical protein B6I21_05655 [candidate division KSB1 bacterium 4572_119]